MHERRALRLELPEEGGAIDMRIETADLAAGRYLLRLPQVAGTAEGEILVVD